MEQDEQNPGDRMNNPHCKTGYDICHEEAEKDEYLIEGIIPKHALNAIVGSSGSGKTTLGQQVALSIVSGDTTILGFQINATHNRVLYISTEDPRHQWKKRLMKLNADGSKDEALKSLIVIFGSIDNLFETIEKILEKEKVDLIIIDVFSDIYAGDPNNNISVRRFFNNFKNLSIRYGTTSLFIHHTGKGTEKYAPSKNSVLGSQAFESSMRSMIEIRTDQYDDTKRHLCILKQNYLAEEQKKQSYVLNLDDDLTFSNTGERKDLAFLTVTSQKVVKDELLRKRILELHEQGLASRGIAEALKEQGFQIGKTKVAETIKEYKAETSDSYRDDLQDDNGPEMGKIVCMKIDGENRLIDLDQDDDDEDQDNFSEQEK